MRRPVKPPTGMASLSSAAATAAAPPSAALLLPGQLRRSRHDHASRSLTFGSFATPVAILPSIELGRTRYQRGRAVGCAASPHLCDPEALNLDLSSLSVEESDSDDELFAAVRLRARTFYNFNQSHGVEDHRSYLVDKEFEALKDRIGGRTLGFKRVCCINASLTLSPFLNSASELSSLCKYPQNGEDRVVVGSLDINQCHSLPSELTGKWPEVLGDSLTRAYLSNVCVAEELQRNGLGYLLVAKSKLVAQDWGITDLYVHVAVDNEAAHNLYKKSGFVYENEESEGQARFFGRSRRFLLWTDLRKTSL